MDMRHDFRHGPEVQPDLLGTDPAAKTWSPEMLAIIGIFAIVWCMLALHVAIRGTLW
jgi:hypothetical protein